MGPTPAQRDLAGLQHTLAATGDDPRTRELTELEALWKGLRYELEGRRSFWDKSVPLRERAPCVVSPLPRTAGRRLISLVFGEGRFPTVSAGAAIPEPARAALTKLAAEVVRSARLRPAMRHVLEQGLSARSACVVCSVRDGHLCADVLPAKWCLPALDDRGCVVSLEVRYKFDLDGELHWYRRTITAEADTVYEPVPVSDRVLPSVVKQSFAQTFCPVVWHRNEPDPTCGGIDGVAMFEGLQDELEALDFSLSQRHRTAQYNGEPFTVRVLGENDADSDGGMSAPRGREADPRAGAGWAGMLKGWMSAATAPAIKKDPGSIVTLSKGGDMKLVESTGAGANILTGDADALRRMILESVEVVVADPETVSANASAALQKALYAPMLARCDGLRDEYGATLCAIVETFLRLLCSPAVRDATVHLPGWRDLLSTLDALFAQGGVPLELAWGEYFEPTWQDIGAGVDAAQKANGGRPVLTLRKSVELIAALVGVTNPEAEADAIEAEEASGGETTRSIFGALR